MKIILSEKNGVLSIRAPKVCLSAPVSLTFFEETKPQTLRDFLLPGRVGMHSCPRRARSGGTETGRRNRPGAQALQGWRSRAATRSLLLPTQGSCLGHAVLENPDSTRSPQHGQSSNQHSCECVSEGAFTPK